MRALIMVWTVMVVAGSAMSHDLGNSRDPYPKTTPAQSYPEPAKNRQGGDTIADAYPIAGLPFTDSGSTSGFANDYDEECPFDSHSPDVVFSLTPDGDIEITVDLCGSSYDTKTYIWDEDGNLIACDDDYYNNDPDCLQYTSLIQRAFLAGGATYFIVVDGYGGAHGDYLLNIREFAPCYYECLADAVEEGEPYLEDGYVDAFNGGCNSPDFGNPFQEINWTNDSDGFPPYDGHALLCGKSGWFIGPEGNHSRDTDWFRVFAFQTGEMEFTVESEYLCYLFKLAPLDCESADAVLQARSDCEAPATLTFPVTAGEEIWLWVGPVSFIGPVREFFYFMTVTNNQFEVVPGEKMSWGEVKSLYR